MDYFLSCQKDDGSSLCIAPITSEIALAHNICEKESVGYFLFQRLYNKSSSDVQILAKLPSEDAAFELGSILGLS